MILRKRKTHSPSTPTAAAISTATQSNHQQQQQQNHHDHEPGNNAEQIGTSLPLASSFVCQKHGGPAEALVSDHGYALDQQQQQAHNEFGGDNQIGDGLLPVEERRKANTAAASIDETAPSCSTAAVAPALPMMFPGSRTDVPTFCAEFVSIAQTFGLSDRACNELINLVKRIAPPNNNVNRSADGVEQVWQRLGAAHKHMGESLRMPDEKLGVCATGSSGATTTTNYSNFPQVYEHRQMDFADAAARSCLEQQQLFTKYANDEEAAEDSDAMFVQHRQQFGRVYGGNNAEEEEEQNDDDDYQFGRNFFQQQDVHIDNSSGDNIMLNVLDSLNRLSNDVTKLRRECAPRGGTVKSEPLDSDVLARNNDDDEDIVQEKNHNVVGGGMALPNASNATGEAMMMKPLTSWPPKSRQTKQDIGRCRPKYFVKVLDEYDQVVPICDLGPEEMLNTVRISREDPQTRILYQGEDITERVLHKLDIALHLHNPSYCGRAAADALFNPEFLCRFHLLAEAAKTTISRANRDSLPSELLSVFYDTLRKLGVSRIIPEHQQGWMEQARDAVNQRTRDIKIPGCRRKFFQNSDPIFE